MTWCFLRSSDTSRLGLPCPTNAETNTFVSITSRRVSGNLLCPLLFPVGLNLCEYFSLGRFPLVLPTLVDFAEKGLQFFSKGRRLDLGGHEPPPSAVDGELGLWFDSKFLPDLLRYDHLTLRPHGGYLRFFHRV